MVGETILAPARYSAAGGAVDGVARLRVAGVIEHVRFVAPGGAVSPGVFVNAPLVHDARVAAICIAHGVRELLTADRDFARFPALS